jgi:hypothetical protein
VEEVGEFVLVLRLRDGGVGDVAQVGEVEEPVVGGAVVGRETGAVQAEDDGELLEADVVDDLVVRALEEGRVDCDDGLEAAGGEAGCEEDGVLLGDADVEELARERLCENGESGAARHGAGDTDDAVVELGLAHEGAAEDLLVGRSGAGGGAAVAGGDVEGGDAVEALGGGGATS